MCYSFSLLPRHRQLTGVCKGLAVSYYPHKSEGCHEGCRRKRLCTNWSCWCAVVVVEALVAWCEWMEAGGYDRTGTIASLTGHAHRMGGWEETAEDGRLVYEVEAVEERPAEMSET